jgi:hypothetical protein
VRRSRVLAAAGATAALFVPLTCRARALPPDIVASFRNIVGSRIEAAVILAGDQGISGGTFSQVSSRPCSGAAPRTRT